MNGCYQQNLVSTPSMIPTAGLHRPVLPFYGAYLRLEGSCIARLFMDTSITTRPWFAGRTIRYANSPNFPASRTTGKSLVVDAQVRQFLLNFRLIAGWADGRLCHLFVRLLQVLSEQVNVLGHRRLHLLILLLQVPAAGFSLPAG